MGWIKTGNDKVSMEVSSDAFEVLLLSEKQLILNANPQGLLEETFEILDKAYVN